MAIGIYGRHKPFITDVPINYLDRESPLTGTSETIAFDSSQTQVETR